MGSGDRDAGGHKGDRLLTTIAQVVPDLPTFSVDDGFAYRVPADLDGVSVGSIVRVPLGGRRVRGYVVDLRTGAAPQGKKLKDVLAVSGEFPVFDAALLETLRWAAMHYVAPQAALLGRAAPPNLPRHIRLPQLPGVPEPTDSGIGPTVLARLMDGRHVRPQYLVGPGPWAGPIAAASALTLVRDRNVAVICPTVEEASRLYDELSEVLGPRVMRSWSALSAAESTRTWVTAATATGRVVVGTREIAMWPLGDLGLAVIVEEGRRAMKAPQTPTIHVREIMRRRASVERFGILYAGTVPTAEVLASGTDIDDLPGRAWPLVEIADRGEEPPGAGLILERTRRAVQGAVKAGHPVFVFVSRRGYAPAFRCVSCGEMRRCPSCGSGPGRGGTCDRCQAPVGPCTECGGRRFAPLGAAVGHVVDDLARSVGDAVGPAGSGHQVQVGTERDLPTVPEVALAVVIDADTMMLAPNYRATEDALRIMSRVATTVRRGHGHRCLIQTAMPHHPVMDALRHGSADRFMERLLEERAAAGFPPAGEIIALEVSPPAERVDGELRGAAGNAVVLGPAVNEGTARWLIQGRRLHPLRIRLRSLVQDWRDGGIRVRIDADPLDL